MANKTVIVDPNGGLWQTRQLLWILKTVVYGQQTVIVDPNGGLWQTHLLWTLTVVYDKHDCYCGS
jgi:hypothetical protein